MKKFLSLLFVSVLLSSFGPPNCNLYKANEPCYEACQEAEKAIMHGQGSRASQIHFDKSIALCPTFSYSYYEKSVPYAKRGLIGQWKELLNKAAELSPEEYLGHLAWYHYFFMKDYSATIKDLEKLDNLLDYDIGVTGNGEYHLEIIRGLSYKGIGKKEKALEIFENQLVKSDYDPGLYDYFHLGVLYMENNLSEQADAAFEKQMQLSDFAEIHYYRGLIAEQNGHLDKAAAILSKSIKDYEAGRFMNNAYTFHMDKVFKKQIELELDRLNKKIK